MNLVEKFFGEAGAEKFLQDFWPGEPYVQDGELARLGEVGTMLEFQNIEAVLKKLTGQVDLVYKDGRRELVPKSLDALSAYRNGTAMLYLKDLEVFPPIARACDELARLVAVPRQYVSCEGFAATNAVEVPLHFDHETNFMVQIRGSKTWRFNKNTSLPNPIFPYFPGNPNRFYDDGRNPFSGERLPCELPPEHVERVVQPGTVTFMPRGFWHSTRTHGESFAIGFVIDPPTLAEIVGAAIIARLHADCNYRAHPLSAHSSEGRADLLERLRQLIGDVADDARKLRAEVLLDTYLTAPPGNTRSLSHPRAAAQVMHSP